MNRILLVCIVAILCSADQQNALAQPVLPAHKGLYKFLLPEETGVAFFNKIIDNDQFNIVNYVNAYNGNGVGVGDLNGDGLPDLYFVATQGPSRLYLNRGNFHFEDLTQKSGTFDSGVVVRGVQFVDIDNDGDLDIYVCRTFQPNRLYINNGDATFTERAHDFGLDYRGYSTQAAFFDYDNDGDLDMYLLIAGGSRVVSYARSGGADLLYRNDGKGKFTDVTKGSGIQDAGYGLNVNAGDVNNDGWTDIYITNDFEGNDILYINNHDGTFANVLRTHVGHTSNSSMGSDMADFNNDGWVDIFTDDMAPVSRVREVTQAGSVSVLSTVYDSSQVGRNCLQLNRGGGYFSDIAQMSGVSASDWSWAALFIDMDNDGWKDLYVVNGMRRDMTEKDNTFRVVQDASALTITQMMKEVFLPQCVFRNNGDLTFSSCASDWGLAALSHSNSAVYADIDNDGDLDLVLNNVDTTAFVYRNMAIENGLGGYLRIKFNGGKSNTYGIGARVEIWRDGYYQMQELQTARGYLGSVEPIMHFGIGTGKNIDSLKVTWIGGKEEIRRNIPGNQVIALNIADAATPSAVPKTSTPAIFTVADSLHNVPFRHYENYYDDLREQRNLPTRQSQWGPGCAVGDINGDGLEDIFFGAGKGFIGRIFLQLPQGGFVQSTDTVEIAQDSISEDMGSIFFDADGDGDLDLYVVSGSIEYYNDAPELQDRLYLNDGKGHFSKAKGSIPTETANGSCVVAADYDGDGDLDLFVGGRTVPQKYPLPSRSYLFRNDGGKFTDVTAELAPELEKPGVVAAALWTDYDNDGRSDLIIAGHWFAPKVFHNEGDGKLKEVEETGLESHSGWWNSITPGDFDSDGDIDYVLGNNGTNWRYAPSPGHPVRMYLADFDGNGSFDLVQSRIDSSVEYPFRDRMLLAEQMPFINQKFTTWRDFSTARLDDIIPREKLEAAYRVDATDFASAYVENLGDGRFKLHKLPLLAQISPVMGTTAQDYDGDGNLDIFLVGNRYDGPEPVVIRYDAGMGLLLRGDGKGNFEAVRHATSGILARADARGLATVRPGRDGSILDHVVVNNRGNTQTYRRDVALNGSKLFTVNQNERITSGLITYADGHRQRVEFPIGSGYLTQNSPTLIVTPMMQSITLFRGKSELRTVVLHEIGH